MKIILRIGRYNVEYRLKVSGDVLDRFSRFCRTCDPDDPLSVRREFARVLEETINTFIAKAYRGDETPDRILARALVYLATELVLVDEALKNAEGGRIL